MENKILLGLTVGQLRTMMAYMDGDLEIGDWIKSYEFQDAYTTYIDEDWPEEEDFEEEDECACEMEDCDYDEEDEEEYYEEDDEVAETASTPLSDAEREAYAQQVADDIGRGAYSIDSVMGILDTDIYGRVIELI